MANSYIYISEIPQLKFIQLDGRAKLPTRATNKSAGLDLYSLDVREIRPWNRATIRTGLSVCLPPGVYGRIAPRSGLAIFNGIDILAGVIDQDFTGEIMAVLINLSGSSFTVLEGMKICQLIIEKFQIMEPIMVDSKSVICKTDRGDKAFGSSGI